MLTITRVGPHCIIVPLADNQFFRSIAQLYGFFKFYCISDSICYEGTGNHYPPGKLGFFFPYELNL